MSKTTQNTQNGISQFEQRLNVNHSVSVYFAIVDRPQIVEQ